MTKKTLGEIRVRTEFNPSEKDLVGRIKEATAELINLVEDVQKTQRETGDPVSEEQCRLMHLAQTSYEEAAMWAVKAATF